MNVWHCYIYAVVNMMLKTLGVDYFEISSTIT